jgi:pimeloyl-ACP methyl ester carboxylesterase
MGNTKAEQSQPAVGERINQLFISDPLLGAETAFKALLTPSRSPLSQAERSALSNATPSWIHVGHSKIAIRTYTFKPIAQDLSQQMTVILSPGYGMTSTSMLKFVPPLISFKFQVVLCDHVAHGESDGEMYELLTCIDTLAELAKQYVPLAGIVGFSLGGSSAAAMLATHRDITCPKLVCMGPPLEIRPMAVEWLRKLKCDPALKEKMFEWASNNNVYLPEKMRLDMGRTPIITNTEVLVTHDKNDPIAGDEEATWLASRFQNNRLEYTTGLKHYGALRSDAVVKLVTDFMAGPDGSHGVGMMSKI